MSLETTLLAVLTFFIGYLIAGAKNSLTDKELLRYKIERRQLDVISEEKEHQHKLELYEQIIGVIKNVNITIESRDTTTRIEIQKD